MSLKFSFKLFKIKLRLPQRASTTPELPGPLSGPWTPAARDFALRARDVRFAHIRVRFLIFKCWQVCPYTPFKLAKK